MSSTNFPTALDDGTSLPSVATGVDNLNAAGQKRHDTKHDTEDAAIKAVETKVGTGSSTPVSGSLLAGTGTGTSAWLTNAVTQSGTSTNGADVTTTSTSYQDSTLDIPLTTTGGNVLCIATITSQNDTGGDTYQMKWHCGGGDSPDWAFQSTQGTFTIAYLFTGLVAGAYTFVVQFKVVAAGTARILGGRGFGLAIELKR